MSLIPAVKESVRKEVLMDNRSKTTLDAWLKFGTVFLIYRLCTYFFFDRFNPDATFFEEESIKLVLFILIGFTIYFMYIQPHIPLNLQHPVIANLSNDMLMFGTVLLSSHLLETWSSKGQLFNDEWIRTAGIILLSFAAYDVIVFPFIPFDKMKPNTASLVYDLTKYGLFLVFFRILQGKSLVNQQWILSVLFVLLGFTTYNVVIKKLIK